MSTMLSTPARRRNVALPSGFTLVRGGRDHLLRVREVAARLGVCPATVYALVERGELAHVRVSNAIRVEPAELEAFVERQRNGEPEAPPKRGRP